MSKIQSKGKKPLADNQKLTCREDITELEQNAQSSYNACTIST
jgi:hypothetical protein